MNPEILAGQQSQYNSKAEIRLIATDNMVSHGGLIDISVGDEDSIYKIVIGMISLCKIISMSKAAAAALIIPVGLQKQLRFIWREW